VFNIEQVLCAFQPDGANQLLRQLQGLCSFKEHDLGSPRRVTIRSTEDCTASPVVASQEREERVSRQERVLLHFVQHIVNTKVS
jgi:hypothetical protein